VIIEHLRRIQDRFGYLPRGELEGLSRDIDVPLHQIQEVVSFFPHYRLAPPPQVEVHVCRDLACQLRGAETCADALRALAVELGGATDVKVEMVSCLGRCDRPPAAMLTLHRTGQHEDHRVLLNATDPGEMARARAVIEAHRDGRQPPPDSRDDSSPTWRIDPYGPFASGESSADSGLARYEAARRLARAIAEASGVESRRRAVDSFLDELKTAELRGMGGAGVPAFRKWSDVRDASDPEKYIICNADESEPATFKDRELLLRTPHLVIEGMVLGAIATGAQRGYVYIRHEYFEQIAVMKAAIAEARENGVVGKDLLGLGRPFELDVFVSPGGYVCGEQGALVEAIEEKRAEPRNKPPQLETNGLFDKPTLLSNVETFAWVPAIALRGGAWYAAQGSQDGAWYSSRQRKGPKGLRFFSICGDVERPGVYEVSIGATLGELIKLAGGVRDGLSLKAVAPSGPSGGFLPATLRREDLAPEFQRTFPKDRDALDIRGLPLDIDEFRALGSMLGAGIVVFADSPATNLFDLALNASRFFRNESCGKCVPCRIGSEKLVQISERLARGGSSPAELESLRALVDDLHRTLELTSICGLGMSAAKPLATALRSFPGDLGNHDREPVRAASEARR
jgi:NADH:ubiquinone oxidoreductase subunit F (NADH-binding)/NADH:ubiquinone oxidoreductase subunit E